jgi:hypothetical protein
MRIPSILLLLVLLSIGCGDNTGRIHGTVSCNGEPLAHGHILFEPIDRGSKQLADGADVRDGVFTVSRITPGRRRVIIKSLPGPRHVAATQREREHIEMVRPAHPIPRTADGNGREVEIQAGDQELDFDIRYPIKAK